MNEQGCGQLAGVFIISALIGAVVFMSKGCIDDYNNQQKRQDEILILKCSQGNIDSCNSLYVKTGDKKYLLKQSK